MNNAISTALIIGGSVIVAGTFVLFGHGMRDSITSLQTTSDHTLGDSVTSMKNEFGK